MLNVILVCCLLYSPSVKGTEESDFLDQFKLIKKTKTAEIALEGFLEIPMNIHILKDSLMLVNEYKKTGFMLSLWNVNNGKRVRSYLNVGRGPGEYIPPLNIYTSGDTIEVWDRSKASHEFFLMDSTLIMNKLNGIYQFEGRPRKIFKVKNGLYFSAVTGKAAKGDLKKHYAVYNRDGKLINSILDYPHYPELDKFSPFIKHAVLEGCYVKHPLESKFAYAGYNTGVFEIYNVEGKIETIFQHIVSEKLSIAQVSDKVGSRFITLTEDHPKGVRSPVATADYIYYLYVGINSSANSNTIIQFDWSGNFLNRYELDQDIVLFTVHGEKFYCIDKFWEKLLVYDLTD